MFYILKIVRDIYFNAYNTENFVLIIVDNTTKGIKDRVNISMEYILSLIIKNKF